MKVLGILLALLALVVLGLMVFVNPSLIGGSHRNDLDVRISLPGSSPSPVAVPVPHPANGTSILGRPSLSAPFMDGVLARVGSPASGTGQVFYDESVKVGIDDAYVFGIFQHESSFGTAGAAVSTRNPGNIICAGYPTCLGRFRSYPTWADGVRDLYALLSKEYVPHGLTSLEAVLQVYAPTSDGNSPLDYVAAVKSLVLSWRTHV